MSIYERENENSEQGTTTLTAERVGFLKKTYQLMGASMIAAAAGAYATMPFAMQVIEYQWVIFGVELLVLFFGLSMTRGKPMLNVSMLFLFTFISGVSLVPLLASFIVSNQAGVIMNAFLMTSVMFGALSMFAINTKADLSSWGKPLMIILIVVIVASVVNMLFLHSGALATLITAGTLVLFGVFTVYDTQNIANGAYDSPVDAAVSLYLDFLNMFISMLQLLGGRK